MTIEKINTYCCKK